MKQTIALIVLFTFVSAQCWADDACERAVPIKLGQPAPCDGILISEPQAQEFAKLLELNPALETALKSCNDQIDILHYEKAHPPEIITPWYESNFFWGFMGLGGGIVITITAMFLIGHYVSFP